MNCPVCNQVDCSGAFGLRCAEVTRQLSDALPIDAKERDPDFNAAQFDADVAESDE